LYDHPGNIFVAGFIGSPAMNFLRGAADGGTASCTALPDIAAKTGVAGAVDIGIRPEHLEITKNGPCVIDLIEALGGVSYVYLSAPDGAEIVVEQRGITPLRQGDKVGIQAAANDIRLFDADTGTRLYD
jgi:lactose/L-arabinose transport system ATP-binding protein